MMMDNRSLGLDGHHKQLLRFTYIQTRAQPDWAYEFPDQTGHDQFGLTHFTYKKRKFH